MEKPYTDTEGQEQENYEAQPLTDPDIQRDAVYALGEDGELHEIGPVPEEVDGDADDA